MPKNTSSARPEKITDWIVICRSGVSVDGRKLEKKMLEQAAEIYDRKQFTAMIWPYHVSRLEYRYDGINYGKVHELKTENRADGHTYLLARLIPNIYAETANRLGQKLFTSCEFIKGFAGTGKWFLSGLALTDVPASLCTQELNFNFSRQHNTTESRRGSVELLAINDQTEDHNVNQNQFYTLLAAISEKNDQYTALEQRVNSLAEQLSQTAATLAAQPEQPETAPAVQPEQAQFAAQPAAQAAPQPAAQPAAQSAEAADQQVTPEMFAQLLSAVNGVNSDVKNLSSQFNQLLQDKTVTPSNAPAVAPFNLV